MKNMRVLRTGAPLALEAIRQVAPAVFAEAPRADRGPRYRYVPSITPLQALLDTGWGVYEASQQRSYDGDKDPYMKHMLRLRKLEDFQHRPTVGEEVAEVIMRNAHDGTSRYHITAGLFRFVCSNGMMVGQKMAGFSIIHSTGSQTTDEVLTAAERVVTEQFPLMLEQVDRFKRIALPSAQAYRLATRAVELRYGHSLPPFPVDDLLRVRRPEDQEPTLWNVLNRVQEASVYGGWETRSMAYGRRSAVRGLERVSAVTKVNMGLWDEATLIAEELA